MFKLPKGISNERAIEILTYEIGTIWQRLNDIVKLVKQEKEKKCDCDSSYTGLPHKSGCASFQ